MCIKPATHESITNLFGSLGLMIVLYCKDRGYQKSHLSPSKEAHKEHVGHAAPHAGLVFSEQICDHLVHGDSDETHVQKRQVSKEEIHGRMESGT